MTKEQILFNHLGIHSYELKTHTLKGEKEVRTIYEVIWKCKYCMEASEIRQEISKEQYDCLLENLKVEL